MKPEGEKDRFPADLREEVDRGPYRQIVYLAKALVQEQGIRGAPGLQVVKEEPRPTGAWEQGDRPSLR